MSRLRGSEPLCILKRILVDQLSQSLFPGCDEERWCGSYTIHGLNSVSQNPFTKRGGVTPMPLTCVGQSRTRHFRFFVKFFFTYGAFRDTFVWQFGVGRQGVGALLEGSAEFHVHKFTLSQIALIRLIRFFVFETRIIPFKVVTWTESLSVRTQCFFV
jgi:hypothetical protein